jgi:hypothetical protein
MAHPHGIPNAMNPTDLEQLRQFLGAYFHQDWELDAPDARAIVERFIVDHSDPTELTNLAALIDQYVESHDDKSLEHSLVSELWCFYTPSADGISARGWPKAVAARFRDAAVADHLP